MTLITRTVVTLILCFSFSSITSANEILKKTSRFVESFEWDPAAHSKVEKFKKYETTYLKYIQTNNEQQIYLGSIMLGLLKNQEATTKLNTIKPKKTSAKIAVLFALCAFQQSYDKNYALLEKLGKETQDVAGANSLANLDVVILLSFLADPRFPKYASSLNTDESFQKEAVFVSLERYKEITKNGF